LNSLKPIDFYIIILKIFKPIVADLLKCLELFLQNLDDVFDSLSGVAVYEIKIS